MQLSSFYFAHPHLFLIPIEELSREGMSAEFARALKAERGIGDDWVALFNAAMAGYWERTQTLYDRAPRSWFAPRRQNVCIVTDPRGSRPYFQPFHKSSWLLYETDFAPDTSSLEFATYLMLHSERLGLLQHLTQGVVHNLSYFLIRDDEEIAGFVEGCGRSTRPDAEAFKVLGAAMPWIRRLYHAPLKAPALVLPEKMNHLEGADLVVPQSMQADLQGLTKAFETVATGVARSYFSFQAAQTGGKNPARQLCAWLRNERPFVLVTGKDDKVLWDPDEPDSTRALKAALGNIGTLPAKSIVADLDKISTRSRQFVDSLRDIECLPPPGEDVDEEGGAWIHATRRIIVYSLQQPGFDPLRESAPAYHRHLLGTRTIHEWGHSAVVGKLVGVPPARQAEFDEALAAICALIDTIAAESPPRFQAVGEDELRSMGEGSETLGQAVMRKILERMPDYLANVLARNYLDEAELEAYIRANIKSLVQETGGPFMQLARYAYEFQYLGLSKMADPMEYLMESTWFPLHFIESGVLSAARTQEFFAAMSRVCACYEVDPKFFVDGE